MITFRSWFTPTYLLDTSVKLYRCQRIIAACMYDNCTRHYLLKTRTLLMTENSNPALLYLDWVSDQRRKSVSEIGWSVHFAVYSVFVWQSWEQSTPWLIAITLWDIWGGKVWWSVISINRCYFSQADLSKNRQVGLKNQVIQENYPQCHSALWDELANH